MRRLIVLSACLLAASLVLAACNAASPTAAQGPFAGSRLWVDPDSQAARDAARLHLRRPAEYGLLRRIAARPQAVWLGEEPRGVRRYVAMVSRSAARISSERLPPPQCRSRIVRGFKVATMSRTSVRSARLCA